MQEVRAFLVAVMRRLGRDKTTDLWFHRKRRSSSSDSHSRISIEREPRYDIFTCELTKYYTDHAPEDLQEVLYLADRYFRDPEETWSKPWKPRDSFEIDLEKLVFSIVFL